MARALDPAPTPSHNTMPAANLPLELQQDIFSHLDGHSFYAARNVCRWWRLAGCDTVTLARQLRKLPVRPLVDARGMEARGLHRLYCDAARTLLLGVRATEDEAAAADLAPTPSRSALLARPKIAAVSRGRHTVTINGGSLALFDTVHEPPKVLLQRPLNGFIEGARQVAWLQIAPASAYALALSSDCALLAVAQERTIHIYPLTEGPEAETVSRTVASAAGHYISGLDFEQDDRVLRVQLSGKSVVLYLGTPAPSQPDRKPTDMHHWRSQAGLRHTFLDSTLLQLPTPAAAQGHPSRLGGLQLLRPHRDGYLFAALRHGGNASSHYIYAHVRCSSPAAGLPTTAEPRGVTPLAKLESFLSASDPRARAEGERGMGSWPDMPSAHEHHPRFALGGGGLLLLLAEREKKRIRHGEWTQLFLYRVPGIEVLEGLLQAGGEEGSGRWDRSRGRGGEKEEVEGPREVEEGKIRETTAAEAAAGTPRHTIARIPLAIATLPGEARDLRFVTSGGAAETGPPTHDLTVVTSETGRRWRLCES